MGGAGLLTPPPNPRHRQDRRCREDWPRGRALPNSESQSLRGRFPRIGTPSASAPMGSRGEPASPDFRIGGKANGADGAGRGTEQISGGGSPTPSGAVGGSKEPPIVGNGGDSGRAGLKIRVPGPEFPSSSSAETPMSCKQGRKRVGNDSGRDSPRVVFLQCPLQSVPGADGEPGPNRPPRFRNRRKSRCRPHKWAG